MKLLITGGAGFIGSAVIRLAVNRGYSVVNVDSLSYAACTKNLSSIEDNPNYKLEIADICNATALDEIFAKFSPDAVMHLAAESHVDRSISKPKKFIETNIIGTFNLLEASRKFWINSGKPKSFRFHHVSTDEVFGSLPNDHTVKFTENSLYDPRSPYSASKASSDHIVSAWHTTYGLPTIITNCSNNYGPYQFPEKLIPLMILKALAEKPLPIYGTGENIRDWLYVDDHAKALLLVLGEGAVGGRYTIGGENEIKNVELINLLCKVLDRQKPRDHGKYSDLITFVEDRPGHDKRYSIDPSRIRNDLGWRPSLSLETGLEQTVRWYLENENWWQPLWLRAKLDHRHGE